MEMFLKNEGKVARLRDACVMTTKRRVTRKFCRWFYLKLDREPMSRLLQSIQTIAISAEAR